MKTRQSGMPSEGMWEDFFDPTTTLLKLGLTEDSECVVDFDSSREVTPINVREEQRGQRNRTDPSYTVLKG